MEYWFLVERTKIDNASFPSKTSISEANVKTNGMASAKWIYPKEWSFARNYLIFPKILLQFIQFILLQFRVNLMYQRPNRVLFDGAFSLWASLNIYKVEVLSTSVFLNRN